MPLTSVPGQDDDEQTGQTTEPSQGATSAALQPCVTLSVAVEDATTPDEAEALVERLGSFFLRERIYRSKVSPVIGTHVGPRVLGVAVLGDR